MTDPSPDTSASMASDLGPVLCIGEAMALVSPVGTESLATAETFEITMAGAEANVARYLTDCGIETGWLGAVGEDPLGDRVLAALTGVGVDIGDVLRSPKHWTGVFFKDPGPSGSRVFYYRQGSAFSQLTAAATVSWPLETAQWVHLSGVTPALSSGCLEITEEVLRRCRRAGVPVSFDVNYRPVLWSGRSAGDELRQLASQATVVFVGLDEAQNLWDVGTAAEAAAELAGADVVVIKDAERTATEFAFCSTATEVTEVPAQKVHHIIDPVGAGDAFAAGYLSQMLRGEPPARRLEMGHSLAAWTLTTPHDFRPGHGPTARATGER